MSRAAICLLFAAAPAVPYAAILGYMTPPQALSEARIASEAGAERAAWLAYLGRSRTLLEADKAALAAERAGGAYPDAPPHKGGAGGMPLNRVAEWYGTPEARHVADNILSFQTPAGGWGKNVDRSGPLRQRGQHYVSFDGGRESWNFVGTIDNNATTTELRFLARVQARFPGAEGQAYRAAFSRGLRYLLNAQYPNGGFPQIFPLQGGYHDAITYNDDAFSNVVQLLREAAARQGDYAFVPDALAGESRNAAERAIGVVLATQVVADGVRTGWCQQHDALTLAAVGARNFEPIALASNESARLLQLLMQLPDPSAEVVAAVHAGAAWLKRTALPGGNWARFYDIRSMKPVFGDRDRSIHDTVDEISEERRKGYGWFVNGPEKALKTYAAWASKRS
ncbi:pectate lyase [Pseudoduganella rhizocola]|uniref:pectate lyase n=1 Tax=Pseudoduganella rhizocola TaxID=3382643 RepID=UPI0038B5CE94